MPTYEYRCKDCGHQLEVVQSFTDDTLTECPSCKRRRCARSSHPSASASRAAASTRPTAGRVTASPRRPPRSTSEKSDSSNGRSSSDSTSSSNSTSSDSNGSSSDTKSSSSDKKSIRPRTRRPPPRNRVSAVTAAEIGVFGGSGFYSFLDDVERVEVDTPYGPPVGRRPRRHAERPVGRLPPPPRRRPPLPAPPGQLPGQRVGPAGARGDAASWGRAPRARCRPDVAPGRLRGVRPAGRPHLGPGRHLLRRADRQPHELRRPVLPRAAGAWLCAAGEAEGITVHDGGTVVVIQGPRFSTRAESAWFRSAGW